MATKRELTLAEDAGWTEMLGLMESLTPEQMERTGYYPEGWSVKDLLAHIGSWQAETGQILQQIQNGTFRGNPLDVDSMNKRFFDANKDLPLPVVKAEAWAARNRMLSVWNELPDSAGEAENWFREDGPEHYQEHLERLREWAQQLQTGPPASG